MTIPVVTPQAESRSVGQQFVALQRMTKISKVRQKLEQ